MAEAKWPALPGTGKGRCPWTLAFADDTADRPLRPGAHPFRGLWLRCVGRPSLGGKNTVFIKARGRCYFKFAFRLRVCSGGGNSSPLSFSIFGGRFFPAGPSLEPGETDVAELLRFT